MTRLVEKEKRKKQQKRRPVNGILLRLTLKNSISTTVCKTSQTVFGKKKKIRLQLRIHRKIPNFIVFILVIEEVNALIDAALPEEALH